MKTKSKMKNKNENENKTENEKQKQKIKMKMKNKMKTKIKIKMNFPFCFNFRFFIFVFAFIFRFVFVFAFVFILFFILFLFYCGTSRPPERRISKIRCSCTKKMFSAFLKIIRKCFVSSCEEVPLLIPAYLQQMNPFIKSSELTFNYDLQSSPFAYCSQYNVTSIFTCLIHTNIINTQYI